jgi:hypothetical protein
VQPRPEVVGQAIVILKTREVRDASLRHDAVIDSHSVGTADPPTERVLAGLGDLRRIDPGHIRGWAAEKPAHISECLQSGCKLKRLSCR